MRICDLGTGVGQLSHALSDLKERWLEAKASWNDDVRRQFEEKYLSEIPTQLQQVILAAQRLSDTVQRAEKDLGDREA
jgi:hypothetical protein